MAKKKKTTVKRAIPTTAQGPKRMQVFSVRLDAERVALAHVLDVDMGDAFRRALDVEIMKREGKCPCCSQKMKWERI